MDTDINRLQLWIAKNEGLISDEANLHAGLRTRIFGNDYGDYDEDAKQNFQYIETEGMSTNLHIMDERYDLTRLLFPFRTGQNRH